MSWEPTLCLPERSYIPDCLYNIHLLGNIQYLTGIFKCLIKMYKYLMEIYKYLMEIYKYLMEITNFLSDCFYKAYLIHTRDCHCRITGSEQHTKPKEKSCVAMKIEETRKEPCQTKFGVVKNTCLPFGLSMFQCFNVCTIESSGCEEDNAD